ncbi:MAG: hypothetical protein HW414_1479, partial [Dehalococcoidia bacterium]|nr:hypothetical protein [Dehalococcoidia bacterium]
YDVNTFAGDDTFTFKLQVQSKSGVGWATVHTTPAISVANRYELLVYPGVGAAAGDIEATLSYPLPRTWRVAAEYGLVGGVADLITFGVYACLIN